MTIAVRRDTSATVVFRAEYSVLLFVSIIRYLNFSQILIFPAKSVPMLQSPAALPVQNQSFHWHHWYRQFLFGDWQSLWLFQVHLEQHGIQHKVIRPYTPRHNGKVERSHRKDNERFYATHSFYSFEDFARQLKVYNHRDYNSFPMRPLGWKTPNQVLRDYFQSV